MIHEILLAASGNASSRISNEFRPNPGIYTAPDTSPKFESTPPKARRKVPPPSHPQKFWYITEVYKMKRSWKMGEKWIKNQFSTEIFACKF